MTPASPVMALAAEAAALPAAHRRGRLLIGVPAAEHPLLPGRVTGRPAVQEDSAVVWPGRSPEDPRVKHPLVVTGDRLALERLDLGERLGVLDEVGERAGRDVRRARVASPVV